MSLNSICCRTSSIWPSLIEIMTLMVLMFVFIIIKNELFLSVSGVYGFVWSYGLWLLVAMFDFGLLVVLMMNLTTGLLRISFLLDFFKMRQFILKLFAVHHPTELWLKLIIFHQREDQPFKKWIVVWIKTHRRSWCWSRLCIFLFCLGQWFMTTNRSWFCLSWQLLLTRLFLFNHIFRLFFVMNDSSTWLYD